MWGRPFGKCVQCSVKSKKYSVWFTITCYLLLATCYLLITVPMPLPAVLWTSCLVFCRPACHRRGDIQGVATLEGIR